MTTISIPDEDLEPLPVVKGWHIRLYFPTHYSTSTPHWVVAGATHADGWDPTDVFAVATVFTSLWEAQPFADRAAKCGWRVEMVPA